MRVFTKISLLLYVVILASCSDQQKRVRVKSEIIENFSIINYNGAKDYPYFSEIENLPIGFSLRGFSDCGSILYLTESANIFPFDDENLKFFLLKEELNTALETYIDSSFTEPTIRKTHYYPYERLVTKNYVLLIISKRRNQSKGRNYEFDVRTYTFDGQLIDGITLAKWDDDNEHYFGGWIMPEMQIKREYDNGKVEYFEIKENGKIVKKDLLCLESKTDFLFKA